VESKEFGIDIWSPANTRWRSKYRDGDEILRRDAELKSKAEVGMLNEDEEW
jgi:hypothetical protein